VKSAASEKFIEASRQELRQLREPIGMLETPDARQPFGVIGPALAW
jgi:hypothetical protein